MSCTTSNTSFQSTRQPSVKFLTAQSLFLEVHGKRVERLISYQAKRHNKSYVLQLSQELEADLSFYTQGQQEVDRLLDVINEQKMKHLMLQMEINLDRSIMQDFIKSEQLELELMEFSIEALKINIKEPNKLNIG